MVHSLLISQHPRPPNTPKTLPQFLHRENPRAALQMRGLQDDLQAAPPLRLPQVPFLPTMPETLHTSQLHDRTQSNCSWRRRTSCWSLHLRLLRCLIRQQTQHWAPHEGEALALRETISMWLMSAEFQPQVSSLNAHDRAQSVNVLQDMSAALQSCIFFTTCARHSWNCSQSQLWHLLTSLQVTENAQASRVNASEEIRVSGLWEEICIWASLWGTHHAASEEEILSMCGV